jgi:peptide deformylase
MCTGEEGCLSLPKEWGKVARPKWIEVRYTDLNNHAQALRLENLNARVVLHEVDHLNGVLFIDRMEHV